ncbi:hypothetical protein DFH06DRAFT_129088 [Mycena polygramma]|nr:hypothetical protein DFH06DRAFT_129088 [Mycena polygramma]
MVVLLVLVLYVIRYTLGYSRGLYLSLLLKIEYFGPLGQPGIVIGELRTFECQRIGENSSCRRRMLLSLYQDKQNGK